MSGAPPSGVRVESRGAIAVLRLDRPPLHVLDLATIAALDAALGEIEESSASVLVLGSTGDRAFSAGVDVKDHTPDKVERMLLSFHGVFRRLHATRLATIAAVRGACLGGGMELALSCDIVIAEEDAKLGLPEIRLACFPPVGIAALADRYGPALAALCLTGETLTGAEAARRGLLSRVVPPGGAEAAALALAADMGGLSPSVLALTARTMRRLASPHFEHSLEKAERAYLEELTRLPDMEEGIRAFMEKRPPRWAPVSGREGR